MSKKKLKQLTIKELLKKNQKRNQKKIELQFAQSLINDAHCNIVNLRIVKNKFIKTNAWQYQTSWNNIMDNFIKKIAQLKWYDNNDVKDEIIDNTCEIKFHEIGKLWKINNIIRYKEIQKLFTQVFHFNKLPGLWIESTKIYLPFAIYGDKEIKDIKGELIKIKKPTKKNQLTLICYEKDDIQQYQNKFKQLTKGMIITSIKTINTDN